MKFNKPDRYLLLPALTFALLLSGCVKSELKELEEHENKIIAEYVAAHPGFIQTEGGLYVDVEVEGNGMSPVKGNYVFINYVGRYLDEGVIRETNLDSLKNDWPVSPSLENFLYGPSKITYGDKMPGINEALGMMKEGGKATFIIPSGKANFDYRPLIYELELLKVVRNPRAYEDSVLNIFIDQQFGDEARIDTFMIWYKLSDTIPGNEDVFGPKDTLFFNFSARLVDGFTNSIQVNRIFDSNINKNPLKYIYGQSNIATGQMLFQNKLPKGLKTALDSLQIQNNSKASLLLGYKLAFDSVGLVHAQDKYIIIPAFQTVQYDIEVTDIHAGPTE